MSAIARNVKPGRSQQEKEASPQPFSTLLGQAKNMSASDHRQDQTTGWKVGGAQLFYRPVESAVALSNSPGGKEENTGLASKFSDKLMMGAVEVI